MKKFRFLFALLLLAGLATSCSKDDFSEPQNADNDRVVISVNANDAEVFLNSTPQFRAASGDLQLTGYALRYILEVWDSGDVMRFRKEILVTDASETVIFDMENTAPGDYSALLWADYIPAGSTPQPPSQRYADKYYDTGGDDGLKTVQLISANYAVNTPARDAFFAKTAFTKVAGTPLVITGITMRRPFGRLNIIETDAALLAQLKKMDLDYYVPLTFHPLNGTISGESSAVINNITTFPNATFEKANLFFDYIFAPTTGQQLLKPIKIKYTLEGITGEGTLTIPANIPIERNKRTNVSGNFIPNTASTKISVDIDDAWTLPDINH